MKDVVISPDGLLAAEVTPKGLVQVVVVPDPTNGDPTKDQERIIMYFSRETFSAWLDKTQMSLRK